MEKNTKISEKETRIGKLSTLNDLKIDAYPSVVNRTHQIKTVLSDFSDFENRGQKITIAGRLRSKRIHGNLCFCELVDESGKIQIVLSKKELQLDSNEEIFFNFKNFDKFIDVGDFIETAGKAFITQKGEQSLLISSWRIISKALKPLPDKWHGLKNEEERFRKRYLDILMDSDLREMFIKKAKFWEVTRSFMKEEGFLEVETPTLETTTGGAEANPFKTKHDDFDINVFLRISVGELWQKRLMAAGFEKTFEIGRVYRNEGSSPNHLQEFTNMEFYWAYSNFRDGMKLAQKLYQKIAVEVFGTTKFKTKEHVYDLAGDWSEIDYREEVIRQTGIDILTAADTEIEKKLDDLNVKYEGVNKERLIDTLWKFCRKNISGPVFLINHPKIVSPLAKANANNPETTERFQIIIAGAEIGNGYSELNNPIDQRQRFVEQKNLLEAGDSEAMMPDWEFVEMLEYGMPPTCGFGFGERLFSFMVDKAVRETTLFPLVKPKLQNVQDSVVMDDASESIDKEPILNKFNSAEKTEDLGIDRLKAIDLLNINVSDRITRLHMIETEAIMRALADHFYKDAEKEIREDAIEKWGIIGLLHDIDWEKTKEDVKNHTILAETILKEANATEFLIESIVSHCYGNTLCGKYQDKTRHTRLHFSLAAAETATGLIIASALMQPDKKLASVKHESLLKKFKQKSFAANCNRDIISEIEKTSLSLSDFFDISLKALQNIHEELGL